jgi:hypothetical protein
LPAFVGYEGTFLMAVASAYFLALNALAAFLFLHGIRLRDDVRALQAKLRVAAPRVEEIASLARLSLDDENKTFKSPEGGTPR